MGKTYNFSAGPSTLPEPVLQTAKKEMLNYKQLGLSVMEMSHRSQEFADIHQQAKNLLRKLMNIPETHDILFLQGGASSQFSMVPLNLMSENKKADYLLTGNFAQKAYQEAKRYGDIHAAASSEDNAYQYIPKNNDTHYRKDSDYIHITTNNTVYGTKVNAKDIPQMKGVPVVADMSSNILSEEYDVSQFGIIYAGAQKNLGPAGVTVVIIRTDLITEETLPNTPTMMKYQIHAQKDSKYNTPPVYSIYIMKLVLEWLDQVGGIKEISKRNHEKAQKLYQVIDESEFYKGVSVPEDRSIMNITFQTKNEQLDQEFIDEAQKNGLINLKGHRSVGGMRASIYNAMPMEGVERLVEFMNKFENHHK